MIRNSVIHKDSQIGKNVKIGSFCTIGANVSIDDNCIVHNNVVIDGNVKIKNNVEIFPFVSIGSIPQDLKYRGENTKIFIDENCKIREFVTINLGTKGGGGITKIGKNCLLMVGTHIAHDCIVGNDIIFANHSTLAGHVIIENNVVVGALSAIHQFSRIGEGAMIGGMSGVTADVIPFSTVMGNRAKLSGLNLVGLKRNNFNKSEITELRKVFKYIFFSKNKTLNERILEIKKKKLNLYTVDSILNFIESKSKRSFTMP